MNELLGYYKTANGGLLRHLYMVKRNSCYFKFNDHGYTRDVRVDKAFLKTLLNSGALIKLGKCGSIPLKRVI